jgi:hypothetical protein
MSFTNEWAWSPPLDLDRFEDFGVNIETSKTSGQLEIPENPLQLSEVTLFAQNPMSMTEVLLQLHVLHDDTTSETDPKTACPSLGSAAEEFFPPTPN